MVNDPNLAFPTRPVTVSCVGVPGCLPAYIGAVFMFLFAVIFACMQSPGIWQDWQIRKEPVAVKNATMYDAICKTHFFFFHACSARVDYAVRGRHYKQSLDFSFVTLHSEDWNVEVVRSRFHPEMVSFDLALDMIWNRVAALAMLLLLLFYVTGQLTLAGKRHGTAKSMEGRAFAFSAVKASIKSENPQFSKTYVTFACNIDGKTREFISMFGKDEEPFYLGDDGDEALAIRPPDGLPPILLDEALLRVELTTAERDALRRPPYYG